jgi:acyl-CoA reductase-like NAD-dependent aldehyde dehydrogenase
MVGAILPWKFPDADGGLEAGAGAGDGNSVVLKPSRDRR